MPAAAGGCRPSRAVAPQSTSWPVRGAGVHLELGDESKSTFHSAVCSTSRRSAVISLNWHPSRHRPTAAMTTSPAPASQPRAPAPRPRGCAAPGTIPAARTQPTCGADPAEMHIRPLGSQPPRTTAIDTAPLGRSATAAAAGNSPAAPPTGTPRQSQDRPLQPSRGRWVIRWKAALNAFDGRLSAGRELVQDLVTPFS